MGGISVIGAAHVAMGSVALVSGAVVLMLPKGTTRHRRVGTVHAAAILAINGTALSMYDLTGRPNVFHVIALVNLATLAMGLLALRRWRRTREPDDLVTHQRRMCSSGWSPNCAACRRTLSSPLRPGGRAWRLPARSARRYVTLIG